MEVSKKRLLEIRTKCLAQAIQAMKNCSSPSTIIEAAIKFEQYILRDI